MEHLARIEKMKNSCRIFLETLGRIGVDGRKTLKFLFCNLQMLFLLCFTPVNFVCCSVSNFKAGGLPCTRHVTKRRVVADFGHPTTALANRGVNYDVTVRLDLKYHVSLYVSPGLMLTLPKIITKLPCACMSSSSNK